MGILRRFAGVDLSRGHFIAWRSVRCAAAGVREFHRFSCSLHVDEISYSNDGPMRMLNFLEYAIFYSPWIYTEVEVSRFLRTHEDPRRPKKREFSESVEKVAMDEAIRDIISYPLNLDHLGKVDSDGVWKWICAGSQAMSTESNSLRKPFVALDKLYELT